MNIPISREESNAISIVRIFAMFSIVICHFFQAYDNWLAFRFNIGVQVFFVLSGYLYGHKEVEQWYPWFIGRFKKLYIPCFLYCLVAQTILMLATNQHFNIKNYIAISAINGIEHLWFMKAIFVCYISTPVLQLFRKYPLHIYICLIIFGGLEFGFLHIQQDLFSWIWLYAIGYFFPLLKKQNKNVCMVAFVISALVISGKMAFFEYNREVLELWHYIVGIALCLIPIVLISKWPIKDNRWLKSVDSYSFYVYITHHIFLLGPLSFVTVIPSRTLLIIVVLLLIILSSIILKKASDYIISLI